MSDTSQAHAVLTAKIRDLKTKKRMRLFTFWLTIAMIAPFLLFASLRWGLVISAAALFVGVAVSGKLWNEFRLTSRMLSYAEQELLSHQDVSSLREVTGGRNGLIDIQD